ncbi:hypothetical protein J8273_8561 [Carpediemonas membranifera]|uniref:Uncharacterized protein n=1 Tax=Carpediemonas membranifera TaxID=201153 RepID=A0A8J6APS6_9EUKA|nr:hypothetical protein J8273_8561 [Carpediemonas membranifera]|eukprot:KAG9389878.1 hypothetical protein J8273_8561 [Carpediemonas membranifera]
MWQRRTASAISTLGPTYFITTACTWTDSSCSALPITPPSPGPGCPGPSRSTATYGPTSPGCPGHVGLGDSGHGQLGFKSSKVDPTRLTFPACAEVAELEASLPPWEKHWMVTDVLMKGDQTFILSSVGTFTAVAVPSGFVPDHIIHVGSLFIATVILSMGDRQVISGRNDYGQLGLGHGNGLSGFVDLPFWVDRIITSSLFFVFLSGRQLLFAGKVPIHIAQSGLLPGFSEDDFCITATPLRFPERVKGFWCDDYQIVWVTEGATHFFHHGKLTVVPIEATAFSEDLYIRFCDSTGQWFKVVGESDGVAELVECEAPIRRAEIIPVDIDSTPQS